MKKKYQKFCILFKYRKYKKRGTKSTSFIFKEIQPTG